PNASKNSCSLPLHGNLRGAGTKCFFANRQLIDAFCAHSVPEPVAARNHDGALWSDFDFGLDDVLFPIALAGGNIAGEDEAGQGGHGDVVSATDAGFQHAAAPYGNLQGTAEIFNLAGFGVATDATKLDIDNAARIHSQCAFGVMSVMDGFVEADGRAELGLQAGV